MLSTILSAFKPASLERVLQQAKIERNMSEARNNFAIREAHLRDINLRQVMPVTVEERFYFDLTYLQFLEQMKNEAAAIGLLTDSKRLFCEIKAVKMLMQMVVKSQPKPKPQPTEEEQPYFDKNRRTQWTEYSKFDFFHSEIELTVMEVEALEAKGVDLEFGRIVKVGYIKAKTKSRVGVSEFLVGKLGKGCGFSDSAIRTAFPIIRDIQERNDEENNFDGVWDSSNFSPSPIA